MWNQGRHVFSINGFKTQTIMNSLKVAIIDDEPDAITSIELIIKEFCKNVEVVATANLIDKGWDKIKETEPDLVFLDIDLPRGSGFDLLERFPIRKFDVVFITAYSKFERKAQQFGALEYLQKPIDIDLFVKVVEDVRNHRLKNPQAVFKLIP